MPLLFIKQSQLVGPRNAEFLCGENFFYFLFLHVERFSFEAFKLDYYNPLM